MIWINWKFIKIRKRKIKKGDGLRVFILSTRLKWGWMESFYFKYSIKMFSYDLILEVDYINA